MFKHEQSKQCRFENKCSNKLCQFQHQRKEINEANIDTLKEVIEPSENDKNDISDSDFDELECDVCGTLFETDDEFTEHQATGTCGFICEPCGVEFKFEITLNTKYRMRLKCKH